MSCAADPRPLPPDIDRLDQHLLANDQTLQTLVQTAELTADDVVLDIGAGTGVITRAVAEVAGRTVAIEIDPRFGRWLDPLPVIYGDIRTLPIDAEVTSVVANPPFGLTEWLVTWLATLPRLRSAALIMGRSFCDKATAEPGSPRFGRLSLQIQARYAIEVIAVVPPDHFDPPTRTTAGIIRLVPRRDPVLAPLAEAAGGTRLKSVLWRRGLLGESRSDPGLVRLGQRRLQELSDADLSMVASWLGRVRADPDS